MPKEVDKHKITLESGEVISISQLVKHSDFSPEHLVTILTEVYNGYNAGPGFDAKVAAALVEQHRTLQQCVIRGFVHILIEMGKKSWGTDPRNEAGIAFCRRLDKLVEDERVHLPFI